MTNLKGHYYSEYKKLLNFHTDSEIANRWGVTKAQLCEWKSENGIFIDHENMNGLKRYRHIKKLQRLGYDMKKISRLTQLNPKKVERILEDYEGVE
ncbi:hypothetical protein [Paenilisteria newyorkensis]|uniref:hypothetical protein n=1 Tax=Listeria newyorkensis TaxID=1497681 RepID=UPI0023588225|nr:hypothetical protein [Listeria newyorkensis]WAO22044.1 hypothetical protein OTR81_01755 [Listeria newyorkensis]